MHHLTHPDPNQVPGELKRIERFAATVYQLNQLYRMGSMTMTRDKDLKRKDVLKVNGDNVYYASGFIPSIFMFHIYIYYKLIKFARFKKPGNNFHHLLRLLQLYLATQVIHMDYIPVI